MSPLSHLGDACGHSLLGTNCAMFLAAGPVHRSSSRESRVDSDPCVAPAEGFLVIVHIYVEHSDICVTYFT